MRPDVADDVLPDRRRHTIGSQTAESGKARPRQADQSFRPPICQLAGGVGPVEAGVGDRVIVWRPAGIGGLQAGVRHWVEPVRRAFADDGVSSDAIDHDIEDEAQIVALTVIDQ